MERQSGPGRPGTITLRSPSGTSTDLIAKMPSSPARSRPTSRCAIPFCRRRRTSWTKWPARCPRRCRTRRRAAHGGHIGAILKPTKYTRKTPHCLRCDRRAARRLVRQRLRHLVRHLVELGLRLRQNIVAHLHIGGDLARLDGAVGHKIGGGAPRRRQRNGADAVLAGSALHCAVADSVPALAKRNCEAWEFATSCCPLPVNTEIWLSGFAPPGRS